MEWKEPTTDTRNYLTLTLEELRAKRDKARTPLERRYWTERIEEWFRRRKLR